MQWFCWKGAKFRANVMVLRWRYCFGVVKNYSKRANVLKYLKKFGKKWTWTNRGKSVSNLWMVWCRWWHCQAVVKAKYEYTFKNIRNPFANDVAVVLIFCQCEQSREIHTFSNIFIMFLTWLCQRNTRRNLEFALFETSDWFPTVFRSAQFRCEGGKGGGDQTEIWNWIEDNF